MPSNYEYSLFSNESYNNKEDDFIGWERINYDNPTNNDYQGSAFIRKEGDVVVEIVIANRGTEETLGDLGNDLQMGVGKLPAQFGSALEFYNQIISNPQYANAQITLTGCNDLHR